MVKKIPVVFHVPHSSRKIPQRIKRKFLLKSNDLKKELILMTDSFTESLYSTRQNIYRCLAKISRLVVDVERFPDDSEEVMSKVGMGVIYTKTSEGKPLRSVPDDRERKILLGRYYHRHHAKFENMVGECLRTHGFCLIIDCHSFSSFRQKYEISEIQHRPEICIGTDLFHTEKWIENLFVKTFSNAGFEVSLNTPFSGSIVPLAYYGKDKRVQSVMIEIRRDLYMDEKTGCRLKKFKAIKKKINIILDEIMKEISNH